VGNAKRYPSRVGQPEGLSTRRHCPRPLGYRGRRKTDGAGRGADESEVGAKVELVEKSANELGNGQPVGAASFPQTVGIGQEETSDLVRIGEAVGGVVGEDVPDGDEELAGNGDDGLVVTDTRFETLEGSFPVRMMENSDASSGDHGGADIAAPFLGDTTGAMSLTGVVDADAHARVTNELFGRGETGDVVDGSKEGDSTDDGDAGELDEEGDSGIVSGSIEESLFDGIDLSVGEVEGGPVGRESGDLDGREGEVKPPRESVLGEGVRIGKGQAVTVKGGVKTILGLGGETDHLGALGDEGAEGADVGGGDPDGREKTFGVESGEGESGLAVSLDAGLGDELDVRGMDDGDGVDVWEEGIVEVEGVGGHLEDEGVGRREVLVNPSIEVGEEDLAVVKELVGVGIDGNSDEIVLVNVEADPARRRSLRHLKTSCILSVAGRATAAGREGFRVKASNTDPSLPARASQVSGVERASKQALELAPRSFS